MEVSENLINLLYRALDERRIAEGTRLLDEINPALKRLDGSSRHSPALVLCMAQWVDVGYKDHRLIVQLLARFPIRERSNHSMKYFLDLRLADAFVAMMNEDTDTALSLIDFVLRAGIESVDPRILMMAQFWKARTHRKRGEYDRALLHIVEAQRQATELNARKWTAAIQIQESWLLFQKGQCKKALLLLDSAEAELKNTGDAISLGNIASARGRIVRRAGEYAEALDHFDRAIAIFTERHANHRNLARTLVNAAYVKRLIALQLRKRIDSQAAAPKNNGAISAGSASPKTTRSYRARHTLVCQEALEHLRKAGEIYRLLNHHTGTGSVLVNVGHLHLDNGDIDCAAAEALKAYELGALHHDLILMARARVLQASAENARVDEQLGEDADISVYANRARKYSDEAVSLAEQTQNRRLLAAAYIARGMTMANDFFQEREEAKLCLDRAAAFLLREDRDHLWEDWSDLKSRVLRASGIDDTLRAWTEGIVHGKTFQQITEEFAEIVISKVWLREEKKIARVVERLSVSPKKVRRVLRKNGLLN